MGEMRDSDWSRQILLRSDWLPTSVALYTTTNAFKCFICGQEKGTTTAVWSLRAKIVIVGNSKRVKNHHFCAKLSHSFSIY